MHFIIGLALALALAAEAPSNAHVVIATINR